MEATRLRERYSDQITILIGFESEWIRTALDDGIEDTNTSSSALVRKLQGKHGQVLDFFVGSVHHVHRVPVDYSRELYLQARATANEIDKDRKSEEEDEAAGEAAGGHPDEVLFRDYFDAQYDMLRTLKPPIIGHFDLIRLYSDRSNDTMRSQARVWQRVMRNLEFIAGYGGILEINSSAVKKGLAEPYPQLDICKVRLPFPFTPKYSPEIRAK